MDNFTTLWNRLRLRCPSIDPSFAQDIVRDSFNQLAERREWSWLYGHSTFVPPVYNITTQCSVDSNVPIVTASAAQFTPDMVGKQIRIGALGGTSYPTYTITQVLSPTILLMDQGWWGPPLTNQQYQIFQCYFPVPQDFQSFISLVNTTSNYRLWTNLKQSELDIADPQRIQIGITFAAAFYDYYPNSTYGRVFPALQIIGAGGAGDGSPVSTTENGFTYPQHSTYTIQILTTGASGNATFQWKQQSVNYSSGWSPALTTSTDAQDLSNGVQVYFPNSGTYTAGDVFIINCAPGDNPGDVQFSGVPRYELWPRPILTPYVYPFLYAKKLPDLTDSNPVLPEFVARRGDILLEMALDRASRWPGTETMRNPYYDLNLARDHAAKSENLIYELERKDDDTAAFDMSYKTVPYYPAPWLDGSWLQTHAIYPNP
jgi:hypothetical protein